MLGLDGDAQHDEDAERDDEEVDDGLDERTAVHDDRFAVFGRLAQRPDDFRKVGLAQRKRDQRRNDVRHKRGNDFAERAADDDADGHVDDVAFGDERLEILGKSCFCP